MTDAPPATDRPGATPERAPVDPGERMEALLDEIRGAVSPEIWCTVEGLVAEILAWHEGGLRRIVALLTEHQGGDGPSWNDIGQDELVSSLALLHGLHPLDLEARIGAALEQARPVLQAHGGDVAVVDVDGGVARLRLLGSCRGCASSSTTLERIIVRAVEEAAPDLERVEILDVGERATQRAGASLVTLDPSRHLNKHASKTPDAAARCDLCAEPLDPEHAHVVDLQARTLRCACRACAILFRSPSTETGRHRTVPDRILHDPATSISPDLLRSLGIPVGLAFVVRTRSEGAVASYPSPAGAVEAAIDPEPWRALVTACRLARLLEPDVEALLFFGDSGRRPQCLLVPIDVCYRLVACVRERWEGFQGGDAVWKALDTELSDLRRRSRPLPVCEGDVS